MIIGHHAQREHLRRLVDGGKIPHLFLFVGPSGVGKKRVAKYFAQLLVCNDRQACGDCGPCRRIENAESESLLMLAPQGTQLKLEQAREVLEFCQLSNPGKARMVIIDQVEKMNPQMGNSLLKLFEEPPPSTYFVLLAPSPSAVLTTVRSRAQVLRFGSLTAEELKSALPETPDWILKSSGGRFDRVEALQNEELLELRDQALQLLLAGLTGKRAIVVEQLKGIAPKRETALWLVKFWREFVRDTWLNQLGEPGVFHSDLISELSENLPSEELQLSEMAANTQALERRLHSNADIQMNLENYLAGMN